MNITVETQPNKHWQKNLFFPRLSIIIFPHIWDLQTPIWKDKLKARKTSLSQQNSTFLLSMLISNINNVSKLKIMKNVFLMSLTTWVISHAIKRLAAVSDPLLEVRFEFITTKAERDKRHNTNIWQIKQLCLNIVDFSNNAPCQSQLVWHWPAS